MTPEQEIAHAIAHVTMHQQCSVSFIQRKVKVGYLRATEIVEKLFEMGIIGPEENCKQREVLIKP